MEILKSSLDKSVNFIQINKQESRFVQRADDYFIVYLSSHNGCNKACRFCHLTQTKQTDFVETLIPEFLEQASYPLSHYRELLSKGQGKSSKVNYNFMARGEPFSNSHILRNAADLISGLKNKVQDLDLEINYNFSTIGPTEIANYEFADIFKGCMDDVTVYYSLYSMREEFRKRWLPKSLPVEIMLGKLKRWQDAGGKIALHWAMIEGENDSEDDINQIVNTLNDFGIKAKFNLVRYNPFSDAQGKESSEEVLQERFKKLANYLNHPHSRIVPRVGFDVKASCGMFIS